jgi:hypothetical protein
MNAKRRAAKSLTRPADPRRPHAIIGRMAVLLGLRAVVVTACIAATGCTPHRSVGATRPRAQQVDAALTILWTSSRAKLGDERLEATFSDAASFAAWWREAVGAAEPVPAVDFARHVVVAISPGFAPNACHGVTLGRARREADTIVVEVQRRVPSAGATCAQIVVHPLVVAAIERPAPALRFAWRELVGTP